MKLMNIYDQQNKWQFVSAVILGFQNNSQISKQSAHGGGKVVSPTHRPPLPPGNIPGTHFF
jgi:hypothetical protein